MKKVKIIVVAVLALLLALSFMKDMLGKASVSAAVKAMTGLKLSMRSMKVGIVRTLIGIKELKLYNPPGFKDELMVDMPEIFVDYNLGAFFQNRIHLEEMRLHLKEAIVVKNEKGELNLNSLKVVREKKQGQKPPEEKAGQPPKMQIDNLKLKIGRVLYKDYSQGMPPQVKEYKVNINESYQNISDPNALISLIIVRTMINTKIASLVDFDLHGLQNGISETLASAQKIATKTAVQAQQVSKKAQEAAKDTVETLKKTTEGLKDAFKLPFGKEE